MISTVPGSVWFGSVRNRSDFDGMQEFLLNVDWYSVIYYNPSAVALWDAFIDVIRTTVDLFVPKRKRATQTTACKRKRYPRCLRKLTCKKMPSVAEAAF